MATDGQIQPIKIPFDQFHPLIPLLAPSDGPALWTHYHPNCSLIHCVYTPLPPEHADSLLPLLHCPIFILPISNPSWVTPADFITHSPPGICNTFPTTNTHCCFYKGHQQTIFIKGNSLILLNLSAPSDTKDGVFLLETLFWDIW